MSGSLPSSLSNLTNLALLYGPVLPFTYLLTIIRDLSGNKISGTLPNWNLTKLEGM